MCVCVWCACASSGRAARRPEWLQQRRSSAAGEGESKGEEERRGERRSAVQRVVARGCTLFLSGRVKRMEWECRWCAADGDGDGTQTVTGWLSEHSESREGEGPVSGVSRFHSFAQRQRQRPVTPRQRHHTHTRWPLPRDTTTGQGSGCRRSLAAQQQQADSQVSQSSGGDDSHSSQTHSGRHTHASAGPSRRLATHAHTHTQQTAATMRRRATTADTQRRNGRRENFGCRKWSTENDWSSAKRSSRVINIKTKL